MNLSLAIVLVAVLGILIGVYVFADGNAPVTNNAKLNSEKPINATITPTSEQAEILVRFNPDLWNTTVLKEAANASHAYIGAVVLNDYSSSGIPGLQLVLLPAGMTAEEGIAYYQSLPYVQYAEKNATYSIEQKSNQTNKTDGNLSEPVIGITPSPGQPVKLLVQFNASAFPDTKNMSNYAAKIHSSVNTTLIKDYTPEGLPGLFLVSLPNNMTAKEGVAIYKNQSQILFAEPDYKISI